jgi:broad specificity phosphatase PhoE
MSNDMGQEWNMKIFLIRHATPNWEHTGIPYDIPPGPALAPKGEKEAEALAEFLKSEGVVKLYCSPFERGARTARIVSGINEIPCAENQDLAEWREVDEPETHVRERMISIFERVLKESEETGPIGLVSHGGPIALLLLELGINKDDLEPYRRKFDTTNPLPPAGVWEIERKDAKEQWNFRLVFIPKVHHAEE